MDDPHPESTAAKPPEPRVAPAPRAAAGLLDPLPLGSRILPNRIVFGAHLTNFGRGNRFTDRHRAYYRERAAGGAALIVTEALTVHPLDHPYEHIPFGHTDAIVESLSALAADLRDAAPAVTVVAQLNHTGGQSSGRILRQSPWAPSPVPDVASRKVSRALSGGEIDQVVAGFAAAAGRAMRAGLDGVELNAGQYSLLRQFLSPLANFRGDDYGGSLENRMRLLERTIAAVRVALPAGGLLGVKLCGDELAPWGGLTPEDGREIAGLLVAAGGLDYLSIEIGGPYSAHVTEAGMPTPQAHAAHLAEGVRGAIAGALPVFAEGRIDSPAAAREVLARGQADGVVMTRALISDPSLPAKIGRARDGAVGSEAEPVRPHVGMARYYAVRGDWNRPLGDLANPRAGREYRLPPPAAGPDRSAGGHLVIGGGPAGLEAATTLARLGSAVHLVEAGAELGGMAALLAREVAARAEFGPLIEYQRELLERLGVRVELNRPIAEFEPWMADYDSVWLATGAKAPSFPLPVPAGLAAFDARGWLLAAAPAPAPDARAVVIDSEGGFRMGNAVEHLLARGYGVDVATEDYFVGRGLVESGELAWFNRVAGQGVGFHPRLRAIRLEPEGVVCADIHSGQERRFEPAALVIFAQPEIPEDGLLKIFRAALAQSGATRIAAIGDARAPRLMGEAILHAHRAVRQGRAVA